MRRTSRSQWATCSRKCSAAGASASPGRPRSSRVCCARHPALALPRILGNEDPYATEHWHCQGYLASATQFWHCQRFLARTAPTPPSPGTAKDFWLSPPSSGTAKDSWRSARPRHPVLALPGISGMWRPHATESWHCQDFLASATQHWHCQGFLARAAHAPLNAGTAKDSWRSARPRPAHRVECLCTHLRRDGRAVECNGLENRRAALNRPLGSNPSPSASFC